MAKQGHTLLYPHQILEQEKNFPNRKFGGTSLNNEQQSKTQNIDFISLAPREPNDPNSHPLLRQERIMQHD